jgi:hypothetical protein
VQRFVNLRHVMSGGFGQSVVTAAKGADQEQGPTFLDFLL